MAAGAGTWRTKWSCATTPSPGGEAPLAAHSPGDVGYPLSVERADGRIFTAYYFPAEDGTVHAAATTWEVDGR